MKNKKEIVNKLKKELNHNGYFTNFFKKYGLSDLYIGKGTLGPEMSWVAYNLTKYIFRNKTSFKDKKVLDMGVGSGMQTVASVLAGAKKVYSLDISPEAIKSIKLNKKKFKMSNVRIMKSNLFHKLTNELFDIIIFNHPFLEGTPKNSSDFVYLTAKKTLNNFFINAKKFLSKNGIIIMPFSYLGDHDPSFYARKYNYSINKKILFKNKYGKHAIFFIKNKK
ncbi:MAG: Rossmann-like fold-containing protein [Candidatus Kerfeldbacteria bacterium]